MAAMKPSARALLTSIIEVLYPLTLFSRHGTGMPAVICLTIIISLSLSPRASLAKPTADHEQTCYLQQAPADPRGGGRRAGARP